MSISITLVEPPLTRVKLAMEPYWEAEFGNPAALYHAGRVAKDAIDNARKSIARF